MEQNKKLIDKIGKTLQKNANVIFAYLYGSFTKAEKFRDIDIAVYTADESDTLSIVADLKISLSRETGIPPDFFDIQTINRIPENGDLFALLYLKRIFEENVLLADKNFYTRAEFIEKYGMKYRECEGLIVEVLK